MAKTTGRETQIPRQTDQEGDARTATTGGDERLPSGRKDPFAGSTVADRSGTRAPVARHLPGDVKVHTEAGPSVSAARGADRPRVSMGNVDTGGRVQAGRVDTGRVHAGGGHTEIGQMGGPRDELGLGAGAARTPYDEDLGPGGERRDRRGGAEARAGWSGEERRLEQADPRFWLGNDRRKKPYAYGTP